MCVGCQELRRRPKDFYVPNSFFENPKYGRILKMSLSIFRYYGKQYYSGFSSLQLNQLFQNSKFAEQHILFKRSLLTFLLRLFYFTGKLVLHGVKHPLRIISKYQTLIKYLQYPTRVWCFTYITELLDVFVMHYFEIK